MKKQLFIILGFFCVSLSFSYSQDKNVAAGGMNFFEGSLPDVLNAAKEQNKYIFVDAFTDWCKPCKWMAANVFPNEEAGRFYNENFIVYKLDMEKGEGIDFAQKYEVRSYPSYLFFDPQGELVHRSVGSKPVEMFIEDGKNALNPDKQFYALQKKYDAGDRSENLLYNYAFALSSANRGQLEIAEVASAYLNTQKKEDLTSEKNWNVIDKLLYDINSSAFKYLEENKDKFAARYGEDNVNRKILITKIEYNSDVGNWTWFAKALPEFAEKYAWNSWDMLNEFAWSIYENIDDKEILMSAEKWIVRSIELEKNYYNTDTYAAILYKLGKHKKALKYANEAIELAKASNIDYKGTQELIEKIKKKK
jgi:thiol-disulfide isomerase/thioredoxin